MGDLNEQPTPTFQEGVAAGTPEGTQPTEPSTEEIGSLYKDLGIKAAVPTGKPKGRPKSTKVRAEDDEEDGAGSSSAGKRGNDDDGDKSKDARASGKNGGAGNSADSKGSKNGKDAGQVQDESEEADGRVRSNKSAGEEDSERGSEDGSGDGAEGAGRGSDESGDSEEEGEDAEKGGKRPGKSNPEVERRIQRLNADKKAAEERADALEKRLQEREQAVQQAKVSQEDPEYTVDDFRKVQDRDGNIIDLDPERAELAWRRWKDGYDQRAAERQAGTNREESMREAREEHARELMKTSVEAYDSLASLMDEYPELVTTSGKFDKEFAADAMPIIQNAIEYLPGTEPGNPDENLPVIVGLRVDPKVILRALKNINNKKRNLPLNGVNDNVESRSMNVPHSRSSDPTVNAANDLYKELGIKKRI